MGDIADYIIDGIIEGGYEEEEESWAGPGKQTYSCKYCKKQGLHWVFTNSWRLFDKDNNIHSCDSWKMNL